MNLKDTTFGCDLGLAGRNPGRAKKPDFEKMRKNAYI